MLGTLYEYRFTPEAVDFYENWDPRSLSEHLDKWYSYDSSKFGYWAATWLIGIVGVAMLFLLQILLVCVEG